MFKVYEIFIVETKEIIYVGKTKRTLNERLSSHKTASRKGKYYFMNKLRSLISKNIEVSIRLIKEFKSEEDANNFEIKTIAKYKKRKIRICNTAPGGAGGKGSQNKKDSKGKNNPFYGKKHTKKVKKILSLKQKERFKNKENHPWYGKENVRMKSDKNPMKNPKVVAKFERPIVQYTRTGLKIKEYKSAKVASLELEMDPSFITKCCRKRKTYRGYIFLYKNDKVITKRVFDSGFSRFVKQFDMNKKFIKEFYSLTKASKETGTSINCIKKCCQTTTQDKNNNFWEFSY